MTILALLQALYADLLPWVRSQSGQLSVAGSYVEVLDVLTAGPRSWLCILEWMGEESLAPDDAQPYHGVMRQSLACYCAIPQGLRPAPGEHLWLSASGRTLIERTEALRDRIRAIRITPPGHSTSELHYRGCAQVLTPEGLPLAAMRLEFALITALPQPDYRDVQVAT